LNLIIFRSLLREPINGVSKGAANPTKVSAFAYLIFTPPSLAESGTKVFHAFALIAVSRKPIRQSLER
jgi:hypothetical protein